MLVVASKMDRTNGDDRGMNIIDCILQDSFQSFSFEDKLRVKAEGRPKPPVKITQLVGAVRRNFNCSMYDKVNWLTGSLLKNRLYCWPCVMLKTAAVGDGCSTFARDGFCDLRNLSRSIKIHEKSKDHIWAAGQLSLLGRVRIDAKINEGV